MCPVKKDGFGAKFGSRNVGLNIGEVLRGDRITNSDYELYIGKDDICHKLCDVPVNLDVVKRARRLIREGHMVEW